jgi:hypothetical protein
MKSLKHPPFVALAAIMLFLSACGDSAAVELQRTQQEQAEAQHRAEEEARQQQLEAYKMAVVTVLKADSTIGATSNGNFTAQALAMRRLDLSQCPRDFATAYIDHVHAWENAAEIMEALAKLRSEENVKDALVKTLLQKLFGSDNNAIEDAVQAEDMLKEAALKSTEKIKSTYQEVERIAVSYGASLH